MNEQDIQFTYIKDNEEIICTIISISAKNEFESYIVFTENYQSESEEPIFKYGILVDNNGSLELKKGITQEELNYIKEQFHEEIIDFSKKTIESDMI